MTDHHPHLSVVIPTRNRCEFLAEAVASITAQTFNDWELVIVDDASEDSTWNWLSRLDDARVRALRQDAPGERSKARNRGLDAARAPFVLFLDDDDRLPTRALEWHVDALAAHSDAIASVGGCTLFSADSQRRRVRVVRSRTVRHVWDDLLFGWVFISGQCLLRTRSVRQVNGWNESLNHAEDHDLWLRISRLGPQVLLPQLVCDHRVHPGQSRPANLDQIMTEIRTRAVAPLGPAERERAEQILQARHHALAALGSYLRLEAGTALRLYLRAARTAPRLLRSPLTRPMIVPPLLKCLLGRTGLGGGRRLLSLLRGTQFELDACRTAAVEDSDQGAP